MILLGPPSMKNQNAMLGSVVAIRYAACSPCHSSCQAYGPAQARLYSSHNPPIQQKLRDLDHYVQVLETGPQRAYSSLP
ncbi:hypothetical protein VTO42DRAFT_3409 [Malbranchea cinnamomea]